MSALRIWTRFDFRPRTRWRFVLLPFLLAALACCVTCSGGKSVPSPPASQGSIVQPVLTTGDRAMLLQSQPTVSFGSGGGGTAVITVDDSITYQQMDGVGASLTDSSAWLLWNKLDASQQATLMQNLFSPSAGIGISFLRQPMGASDFSAVGNYSYDDMPAGQTDPNLLNFSISHDTAYIIPLVKQALTINPALKVAALPWSPPAWMKTTGTMNGGGVMTTYFPILAQYFVKFIQAYQQQGISIYAISVQNEPLFSTTSYPSESLPASDASDFIANHLGPALNNASLSSVKILAYEHNWDNPAYPESVLASSASIYVSGTSFHCYAGDVAAQSQVEAAYPSKGIWFTECTGTVGSNFAGDLAWDAEHLLIGATRNWARSVSLWNLALDQNSGPKNGGCSSCRGVVTIDDSTIPSTITYNVEYYVLGHLGKFVVSGAVRIASNTFGPGSIEDVAFKNPDGSKVLLVLNGSTASSSFTVNWKGENFNYTLPAGALATFTWK